MLEIWGDRPVVRTGAASCIVLNLQGIAESLQQNTFQEGTPLTRDTICPSHHNYSKASDSAISPVMSS
jgi:hypothetical protein